MKYELHKRILSSILLIPLTLYLVFEGNVFFNFFILLCLFLTIYDWVMMNNKKFYIFLGVFFLIFSFFTIYKIRNELGMNIYTYYLF